MTTPDSVSCSQGSNGSVEAADKDTEMMDVVEESPSKSIKKKKTEVCSPEWLKQYYSIPNLQKDELVQLFQYVCNDKKNREGVVLMVGIKEIGKCVIDHAVKPDDFIEAYLSLQDY